MKTIYHDLCKLLSHEPKSTMDIVIEFYGDSPEYEARIRRMTVTRALFQALGDGIAVSQMAYTGKKHERFWKLNDGRPWVYRDGSVSDTILGCVDDCWQTTRDIGERYYVGMDGVKARGNAFKRLNALKDQGKVECRCVLYNNRRTCEWRLAHA